VKILNQSRAVIRLVDEHDATRLLDGNRAVDVYDAEGKFLGLQMCERADLVRQDRAKESGRAAAAKIAERMPRACIVLSKAEAEAVAERRASRTEGMSFDDPRRDARIAAGRPEMDAAEAARAKFNAMFGAGAATMPGSTLQSCAA
jgi:hypothetical protein